MERHSVWIQRARPSHAIPYRVGPGGARPARRPPRRPPPPADEHPAHHRGREHRPRRRRSRACPMAGGHRRCHARTGMIAWQADERVLARDDRVDRPVVDDRRSSVGARSLDRRPHGRQQQRLQARISPFRGGDDAFRCGLGGRRCRLASPREHPGVHCGRPSAAGERDGSPHGEHEHRSPGQPSRSALDRLIFVDRPLAASGLQHTSGASRRARACASTGPAQRGRARGTVAAAIPCFIQVSRKVPV